MCLWQVTHVDLIAEVHLFRIGDLILPLNLSNYCLSFPLNCENCWFNCKRRLKYIRYIHLHFGLWRVKSISSRLNGTLLCAHSTLILKWKRRVNEYNNGLWSPLKEVENLKNDLWIQRIIVTANFIWSFFETRWCSQCETTADSTLTADQAASLCAALYTPTDQAAAQLMW